jgi:hypothetical protein
LFRGSAGTILDLQHAFPSECKDRASAAPVFLCIFDTFSVHPDIVVANPPTNAVKYFGTAEVMEMASESAVLNKIRSTVYQYWRGRTRRRQGCTGLAMAMHARINSQGRNVSTFHYK